MTDVYRPCASILVLRKLNVCLPGGEDCDGVYEVLLLKKPRKKDAWQLPQGGVEDGETTEQAALRELKEEAGIDATLLGKSTEVYKYDFPSSYRRFRPDNVCGQRIEYVYALYESSLPVQVDQKEIEEYVWVMPEELGKYLKRKEYKAMTERMITEAIGLASARE